MVLFHLLKLFVGVSSEVSYCDLGILTHLLNGLGEFLTSFLCYLRDYQSDALAVVRGIDADICNVDGLFDLSDGLGIEGADEKCSGIGHRYV